MVLILLFAFLFFCFGFSLLPCSGCPAVALCGRSGFFVFCFAHWRAPPPVSAPSWPSRAVLLDVCSATPRLGPAARLDRCQVVRVSAVCTCWLGTPCPRLRLLAARLVACETPVRRLFGRPAHVVWSALWVRACSRLVIPFGSRTTIKRLVRSTRAASGSQTKHLLFVQPFWLYIRCPASSTLEHFIVRC